MGGVRQFCLLALFISMHLISPSLCVADSNRETLTGPGSRISLKLNQKSILSHESVTLEVTIELARGAVLIDSGQFQALKNWIVIHQESGRPTLTLSGGRRWKQTFHLAPTLTGNVDFDGLQFSIRPPHQEQALTLQVRELRVQVNSLLTENPKLNTLKDVREPETEFKEAASSSQSSWGVMFVTFTILGLGGILSVLALFFFLKRRKKAGRDRPEKLLEEQENLKKAMEGLELHRQVISMLRAVFSRTITPQAPSLSALELREILSNSELPAALQSELRQFLSVYDELAFSEHSTPEPWTPERLAQLRSEIQGFAKHRRSS